jgi:hypothetical protein
VVNSAGGHGTALTDYRYFENAVAKGNDPVGSAVPPDTYFATSTFHKIGNAAGTNSIKAYEGYVAEVLVYNSALNNAERLIVDNYLSAKYNTGSTVMGSDVTLGANDRYEGDLNAKKDYDFDVFGIGRIDGTHLLTTSENNAGLQLTGDASLTDGEWLLAGHKTPTNSILPGGQWARVWYIDKTETNGLDATLTFDYSDGGLGPVSISSGAWTQIQLLYSTSDPFNFNSLAVTGMVSGDQISFNVPNSLLLDGYYTLLVAQVPEPSTLTLAGLGLAGVVIRRRRGATAK